jgi:hypothetical protein
MKMNINNRLSFNLSPIYPSNSHIRWGIDGKGYIGNKVVFQLHNNNDGDSYIVSVINQDNKDIIEQSPIFWEAIEWSKIPNNKNFNHNARRSAMQWAEDYLLNAVTNQLSLS